MPLSSLIHLGDLRVTAALAIATAVWLLTARFYSCAGRWCLAYGVVLGLVAASKIAYLAWGTQIAAIAFKAVSGHAAGSAAVLPVVMHLFATSSGNTNNNVSSRQSLGAAFGWLISAAVAFQLVRHGEHTPAEAFAGWCIGAVASWGVWIRLRHLSVPPSLAGAALASIAAIAFALTMQFAPVGRWMTHFAVLISRGEHAHAWTDD